MNSIKNKQVAVVFENYPDEIKSKLLFLRQLIFETATETEGVGDLAETLKWGQPSYLTKSKSGSTIRIDATKTPGQYAMYVHCQTNLVEMFKERFPKQFKYEGKRAILFDEKEKIPVNELRHCIRLALTYHLNKKT